MTTITARADTSVRVARPSQMLALRAFSAIVLRDLWVVRKTVGYFLVRVVTQPLLLVFVFAYVFPKIGQSVGGSGAAASRFSTLLAPGMIAMAIVIQGIQAVALPLVNEFGYTREIEDRVMAPLPIWAIGLAKITSGAIQSAIAAFLVVPFVLTIPVTDVVFDINWPVALSIGALACVLAGSLGLAVGTRFEPRQVPLIFSVLVIPMTMLGAVYYPWSRLGPISWLKWAVLVNPLLYMSEGLRMGLTTAAHMSTWAIYGALIAATLFLMRLGLRGFEKRVLS
jgi:ABC-2 type transport system permease protein